LAWCLIFHAVDVRAKVYEYAVDDDKGIIAIETQEAGGVLQRVRSWAKLQSGYNLPQSLFSDLLLTNPSHKLQLQKEIKFKGQSKEITDRFDGQAYLYKISADANYNRVVIKTNGRISQRILTEPKLPFIDLSEYLLGGFVTRNESTRNFYTIRHSSPITLVCDNTVNGKQTLKQDGMDVARVIPSEKYNNIPQQLELLADDNSERTICRINLRGVEQNVSEIGEHTANIQPGAFVPYLEEPAQRNNHHQRSFEQRPSGTLFLTRHLEAHDVTSFIHNTLKEKLKRCGVLLKDDGYQHIVTVCETQGGKINAEIKKGATLQITDESKPIRQRKQKTRQEKRNVQYDRSIKYTIVKDTVLRATIAYSFDREVDNQSDFSLIKDTVNHFWQAHHQRADYYKFYLTGDSVRATGMKERFLFDKTLGTVDLPLRTYWDKLRNLLHKQNQRFDRELSASVDKTSGRLILHYRILKFDRAEEIVLFYLLPLFRSSYYIKPDGFTFEKSSTGVKVRGWINANATTSVSLSEVKKVFIEEFSSQPNARKTYWHLILNHQHINLERQSDLALPITWEDIRSALKSRYNILEEISFNVAYGNALQCRFLGYEKK
jgi:hypothetical protein